MLALQQIRIYILFIKKIHRYMFSNFGWFWTRLTQVEFSSNWQEPSWSTAELVVGPRIWTWNGTPIPIKYTHPPPSSLYTQALCECTMGTPDQKYTRFTCSLILLIQTNFSPKFQIVERLPKIWYVSSETKLVKIIIKTIYKIIKYANQSFPSRKKLL